jgi:hypothetical protein
MQYAVRLDRSRKRRRGSLVIGLNRVSRVEMMLLPGRVISSLSDAGTKTVISTNQCVLEMCIDLQAISLLDILEFAYYLLFCSDGSL